MKITQGAEFSEELKNPSSLPFKSLSFDVQNLVRSHAFILKLAGKLLITSFYCERQWVKSVSNFDSLHSHHHKRCEHNMSVSSMEQNISNDVMGLSCHLITVQPLIGRQVSEAFSHSNIFKSCRVLSFRYDYQSLTSSLSNLLISPSWLIVFSCCYCFQSGQCGGELWPVVQSAHWNKGGTAAANWGASGGGVNRVGDRHRQHPDLR